MISRIVHFSVENKFLIGVLIVAMTIWGLYSFSRIPIDAIPDITDNQVQVITNSPNLAVQEVEQFITYPLEIAMANIPGVLEIRSISRFGLSVITVVFEDEVDIYKARQLIQERLSIVEGEIPPEFGKPYMGPITTGLGMIYQYVLYPEEGYESVYSPMELRSIQDWNVKRQLAGIDGVIEINSSGGYLKQYEVAVDPATLRSMEIGFEEIINALSTNNLNTGGAYIEKDPNTYFIRGEGLLDNIDEIKEVVILKREDIPVFLRDIAEVRFGNAPRFGAVTMDGKGEVVAGQVMMLKGENSAEVTERVKARIEEIRKTLPEGVVLEEYLDRSELIGRTIGTVRTNLIEGGLIVIFILVLLLGNFRAGLVVASVIPLSLLFAGGMMSLFGVTANLMSLGAIDFGLIVDGAVIVVERVVFVLKRDHFGARLKQFQMDSAVKESASKIMKSAAFGEIIILIVYIPILTLSGIEGKMFKPMAQTVSFAILGALILSVTYVPMISSLVLNKKVVLKATISDRIIGFLYSLYQPLLKVSLRNKIVVVLLTLGLFGFSFQTFRNMGGEFIPTLEEGDLALHQILPPGSSLSKSVEVSGDIQDILLKEFPEVEKVVTKIGTAEIPTDIMPLEAGDIYVNLKPKDEWTSASSREELFEKMEHKMKVIPGITYEFTQPIQMLFNELMTGVRQDIAIKIYGENMGLLLLKAHEAEGIINTISGVGDMKVEQVAGLQQFSIQYDRDMIARYGLTVQDVSNVLGSAFAGKVTGFIFEGDQKYELVVRLDPENRKGGGDISNLYVDLPSGQMVPLNVLASVNQVEGPSQISRENSQRRITIGVNARNRDVESLVEEIHNRLDNELDLPAGYYIRYGGQFENLVKARARLSIAVPLALSLILIILFFTFNSFRQALLIFTAIPLAAIGGIWSLYLRDMPFSISAGVGFIALFGVAVLNGIVLIASFNELKQNGVRDITQRIMEGTKQRMRPVIMTASVASLGFLPMALSQTAGAEVQRPLATVVIGGLITATFLTLVLLPVLYQLFEPKDRKS